MAIYQCQGADELRPAEHCRADRARSGAEHREDQHDKQQVRQLEHDPERTEQVAEEAAVIETPCCEREQKREGAHGAPGDHREHDRHDTADGTARNEELRKLAAGRVAASDYHRLEREARQQEALEPRRRVTLLRHAVES